MVKTQKGFTLIELMIVIAIIGILAAVAVPQYGQYTKRAKFADVITQTAAIKTAVSLCYQDRNVIADCDGGAFGIVDVNTAGPVVDTIVTTNGVITATGGVQVDAATYILDPGIGAAGAPLNWSVDAASTCAASNLCKL